MKVNDKCFCILNDFEEQALKNGMSIVEVPYYFEKICYMNEAEMDYLFFIPSKQKRFEEIIKKFSKKD